MRPSARAQAYFYFSSPSNFGCAARSTRSEASLPSAAETASRARAPSADVAPLASVHDAPQLGQAEVPAALPHPWDVLVARARARASKLTSRARKLRCPRLYGTSTGRPIARSAFAPTARLWRNQPGQFESSILSPRLHLSHAGRRVCGRGRSDHALAVFERPVQLRRPTRARGAIWRLAMRA